MDLHTQTADELFDKEAFDLELFRKIKLDEIWDFDGDAYHAACFGWQRKDESLRVNDLITYGYIEGFKSAADLLVSNGACPDAQIFPVIFCYRQYLELLLKHIYQTGLQDDDSYIAQLQHIGHDLHKLWAKAKPYVKDYLKDIDLEKEVRKDFIAFLETVIDKFMEWDSTSFNFRYPQDKQLHDSIREDSLWINLKKLQRAMKAIDNVMFSAYGL